MESKNLIRFLGSVFAALLFLNSNAVKAADWKIIGDDLKTKILIDVSQIETDRLGRKSVWVKFLYTEPKLAGGKLYYSTVEKLRIDCDKRTYDSEFFALYDKNGDSISSSSILPMTQSIIPGSVGEVSFKYACFSKTSL